MVSAKWTGTLAAALAWVGLAWGQSAAPAQPAEKVGFDVLTVQEAGKPSQRCLILKSWQQPEGSLALEVLSLETGERLTIVEMRAEESAASKPGQGMPSRIYHWGDSSTPPPGVPQRSDEAPAQSQESGVRSQESAAAMAASVPVIKSVEGLPSAPEQSAGEPSRITPMPADNDKTFSDASSIPAAKLGPIQTETAKPSVWRQSWGKADNHQSILSSYETPQEESKKDNVVLTGGDEKAASAESAPVNAANKPGPEPAGYVDLTDVRPYSRSSSDAKRPARMLLTSFRRSSQKDQGIMAGSAVATQSGPAMKPTSTDPDLHQLQRMLGEDLLPSRREKAADMLSAMDWRHNREILGAILTAAGQDPAATVRAACVRCLVKMQADTLETVHLLQSLKADADPRVREEAEKALATLGVPQTKPEDQPVHQISAPASANKSSSVRLWRILQI